MQGFLEQVKKLAAEVSVREGCTLYDIEFIGAAAGRTLRVYIDREGAEGVSITDCSNVSRGLNLLLDVEDVIPGGKYNLEVSSPGLDRILKERWHFEKVLGQMIAVKTFAPLLDFNAEVPELGKAKQLSAKLTAVEDAGLRLEWNEKPVFVPFEQLTKSHQVFEFTIPSENKPGHKQSQKHGQKHDEQQSKK